MLDTFGGHYLLSALTFPLSTPVIASALPAPGRGAVFRTKGVVFVLGNMPIGDLYRITIGLRQVYGFESSSLSRFFAHVYTV